jgi:peptide/nickel transport system permease protein
MADMPTSRPADMPAGQAAGTLAAVAERDLAGQRWGVRGRAKRRRWNAPMIAGLTILGLVLFAAIVIPIVSPYSVTEPDLAGETFAPSSWAHPLGTDNFGRDTLTRIAYGGRIDLAFAVFATLGTFVAGTILGIMTGYLGGWFDTIVMRVVDIVFAFPFIVLVIGVITVLGTGTLNIYLAIWIVGWSVYARIVRGEVLVARRLEYVEAARVIGMRDVRVMVRHIMPNVVSTAIVFAMADAVANIILASSLSFIALGVQPPQPEWGLMLAEGRDFFLRDWRLTTYPGLAVLVVGAGFSLLGDGLAEALRPRR